MSKLRVPVSDQDHQTGNAKAKIVMVEYGDYQCPHCGFAHPLIKKLLKEFNHDLLFIFRNFPLQEMHPQALISAQAAEAADKQHKFWEMHDMIFENQDILSANSLLHFAKQLNLGLEKFSNDWKSKGVLAKVETDFDGGIRSGVNGTPTFFINGNRLETYDASYESLARAVLELQ
ncbi:MAG TPA: DsbA family protein [Puia sp.]|jgi:protein-disulfide isomerase|nr:DsbA family protein [Puia sp.]